MKIILKVLLFVALVSPATVDAQPAAGRLDRAAELSRSAADAGSLEQARSLSSTALDAAPKFDGDVVDAAGAAFAPAASKQAPALTFAPARSLAAQVPAPARSLSRGDGGGHAGAFMIAGALSPLAGAVIGALLGGGPGAVIGALLGTAVGLVLFAIGAFRALRNVFNP